jgi:hypothetical protein
MRRANHSHLDHSQSRTKQAMESNEKPEQGAAPDRKEPESRAVGILLNAPNILSRLVDTAVLLTIITGILYAWGFTYFTAFIQGLGLKAYTFAFKVPADEMLLGGTNVISYFITGVPIAYWSIGLGLMAVILLVGFVQLILVPVLTKLASFVTPSLAKAGRWVGRQFLKVGVFHKLRKLLASLAPKESSIAVYERTLTRFKGSAELYIAHAIVITLLVILLV